jgi:hypothetical protein
VTEVRRLNMSDTQSAVGSDETGAVAPSVLEDASRRWPFGPHFFLEQLRAFARDCCPDPADGLPFVEVRLADGEVLDLCHVVGVGPAWVVLAVNDSQPDGAVRMKTEFVPYAVVVRVTVRPSRPESPRLGFDIGHASALLARSCDTARDTAEQVLCAVAGTPPLQRVPGVPGRPH